MANATKEGQDSAQDEAQPEILWTGILNLNAVTSGGQGNYRAGRGQQGGLYFPADQFEAAGRPGMVRVVVMPLTEADIEAEVRKALGSKPSTNGNGSGRA